MAAGNSSAIFDRFVVGDAPVDPVDNGNSCASSRRCFSSVSMGLPGAFQIYIAASFSLT